MVALRRSVPLLEAFAAQVPGQVAEESRTLLAKFGLKEDHVLRPASSLSLGERTRAVTHDRRMLESISVTRRFVVSDGQVGEVDVA